MIDVNVDDCVDFSLEEEYLFGALCITIIGLKGLKHSAGLYSVLQKIDLFTCCLLYSSATPSSVQSNLRKEGCNRQQQRQYYGCYFGQLNRNFGLFLA